MGDMDYAPGILDWEAGGYFGIAEPPGERDLDRPEHLWAEAFLQARQGRFDLMPRLLELYRQTRNFEFEDLCITLLGDAGTPECFDSMIQSLLSEIDQTTEFELTLDFCSALYARGKLADVPLILSAFEPIEYVKDAAVIPCQISELLEFPVGKLTDLGNFSYLSEYREAVLARCGELMSRFGTDQVYVFGGERFSVVSFAKQYLKALEKPQVTSVWRHKFEASTGADCSNFYRDGQLQREAAKSALKAFLNNPDRWDFSEGARYFFGHRLPG